MQKVKVMCSLVTHGEEAETTTLNSIALRCNIEGSVL